MSQRDTDSQEKTGLLALWAALEGASPLLAQFVKTLAVAFQLGLLVVIIYEFKIETRGFLNLSILVFGGFIVHSMLPRSARLHFFSLLSLASLVLVLGWANAAWIVGLGAVLVLLCHAPLPWAGRATLLLAAGVGLVALREGWLGETPISNAIWPILGSMFMFRVMVYLYDLKSGKLKPSPSWSAAYFFMIPNVCFPLFPVVDSTKFRTTYYNEEEFGIYQRGIHWMFRGLVQLVGYRLVYYYMALDPNEVAGVADLLQYTVAAFLLYLRVSGYFHLVVGMLLLFGFNLPETHHRYFFASSFTDFWRRINIYWKDFMMKLFYYPAYFKLRKLGNTTALVVATCFVFLMTWLLHAYQWYWLLGGVFLETHDILFWSVLGVLVVGNSLWEQRKGRRRTLGRKGFDALTSASVALKTVATFCVICTLWGMWTADSFEQFVAVWQTAGNFWIFAIAFVAALYGASVLLDRAARRRQEKGPRKKLAMPGAARPAGFWRTATLATLPILLVAVGGDARVFGRLGAGPAEKISSLQESRLNTRDTNMLERGYYEQLVNLNQNNSQLWELYNKEPIDWVRLTETAAWRPRADMLLGELVPNTEFAFKRQPTKINRWGFRDQDYEMEKPEGTWRMAVLGASHVFGSGVANGENFESQLEDMLNENTESRPYAHYEILNFGVPNRSATEDVEVLREKVYPFHPDAIIHFAHTHDLHRLSRHIPKIIHASGGKLPFEFLERRFEEIGVGPDTSPTVIEIKIRPHSRELLSWAYRQIVEDCRERGVLPIYVLLPRTWERTDEIEGDPATLLEMAREAGFVVVDVTDAYDGQITDELVIASWDFHPNRLAHSLLAKRIYRGLSEAADFVGPVTAEESTRVAASVGD